MKISNYDTNKAIKKGLFLVPVKSVDLGKQQVKCGNVLLNYQSGWDILPDTNITVYIL